MAFTFNETTALVTGASSGIGYALAAGLAARGVNLIITARRKDRLAALAEQLGVQVTVVPIAADLSSQSGVDDLIAAVQDLSVTVDVLVNCAGLAPHGKFLETTDLDQQALVQLNVLFDSTLFTRHAKQRVRSYFKRVFSSRISCSAGNGPIWGIQSVSVVTDGSAE